MVPDHVERNVYARYINTLERGPMNSCRMVDGKETYKHGADAVEWVTNQEKIAAKRKLVLINL